MIPSLWIVAYYSKSLPVQSWKQNIETNNFSLSLIFMHVLVRICISTDDTEKISKNNKITSYIAA